MSNPTDWMKSEYDELVKKGFDWKPPVIGGPSTGRAIIDDKERIMLCANNYLSMSNHPKVKQAAIDAVTSHGAGSGSVRPIAGNMDIHNELEDTIARFKNREAALYYQTGFAVNSGLIPQLAGKNDSIISDQLNHGSIIDGVRLSGVKKENRTIYAHNDMGELEDRLKEATKKSEKTLVIIMSEESSSKSKRKLVLPGDLMETKSKPGRGIFRKDGRVHASVVGHSSDKSGYINVNGIKGRYNPKTGDKIIAICAETGPSIWRMDIGAAFNSTLHHSESGWKVPFGDTARFLSIGDAVWAEIFMVDAAGTHQITLKKDDCRKLYSGTIVKINPTNVPRVIGKQGSMITTIREKTQTRIQIGQNGCIWIDGKGNDISLAQKAVEMIDEEATSKGLTKKIEKLLEK